MRMRTVGACLAALALVGASCGGDDDDTASTDATGDSSATSDGAPDDTSGGGGSGCASVASGGAEAGPADTVAGEAAPVTAPMGSAGAGAAAADPAALDVKAPGETLTVWIMEGTNPDAKPFFADVRASFEEQTGAKLDVKYVDWEVAKNQFTTGIASGDLPDVAEVGTTWTPEFAEAGALVDITERVESAGLGDDLVDGLVEAGTVDGGLYGMPWYSGVRSIIYRTDVFDELGIDPPTSWDDLVAAGCTIKEAKPKMLAFPVAGDSEYGVDAFVWGAGGDVATEADGTWTAELDSPASREGIAFYTSLATEYGFSTPAASTWTEQDLSASFTNDEAAMMLSGSWTPKALIEENPDLEGKIGAIPIPGPDGGLSPSFLGGSHLGIFNTTENEDLAWAFVELMSTGKFAQQWGEQSGFFPGTKTLLEQIQAENDPLVAPFAKQMVEAGKSVPVTPLYGQIQTNKTMAAMLSSILDGDATVDEATETATQEMNDVFGG